MINQKPNARHFVILETVPTLSGHRIVAPWLGDLTAFAVQATLQKFHHKWAWEVPAARSFPAI
jgi:hypothetical protein